MLLLYSLLFGAMAFHLAYYYPQLPERLAVHFGAAGAPDGWMLKDSFVVFSPAMLLGVSLVFYGLNFVMRHAPPRYLNLPHKDYWLAPERREQTLRRMGQDFLLIGLFLGAFLLAIEHLLVLANLRQPPGLDVGQLLVCTGALVVATMYVLLRQLLRLRLPKDARS